MGVPGRRRGKRASGATSRATSVRTARAFTMCRAGGTTPRRESIRRRGSGGSAPRARRGRRVGGVHDNNSGTAADGPVVYRQRRPRALQGQGRPGLRSVDGRVWLAEAYARWRVPGARMALRANRNRSVRPWNRPAGRWGRCSKTTDILPQRPFTISARPGHHGLAERLPRIGILGKIMRLT